MRLKSYTWKPSSNFSSAIRSCKGIAHFDRSSVVIRPGERTMNRRHAHHFAKARRIRIGHLTMANFGFLIFFVFGVFAKPVDSQSSVEFGRSIFQRTCGTCHGGDGLGGEMGPNLAYRQARLSNDQLSTILHDGIAIAMTSFIAGTANMAARSDSKGTFLRGDRTLSNSASTLQDLQPRPLSGSVSHYHLRLYTQAVPHLAD